MKKWIMILGLGLVVWNLWQSPGTLEEAPVTITIPTQTPTPTLTWVRWGEAEYRYLYYLTQEGQSIELYPNYETALMSHEIRSQLDCEVVVNAGFYTSKRKPIGYFATKAGVMSESSPNELFNGLVGEDHAGWKIEEIKPEPNYFQGFQSGPVLVANNLPKMITLRTDERRRRMVALVAEGKLGFMAVYDPETIFGGPRLTDLPAIVQKIGVQEKLAIEWAVNLDGGSASIFVVDGGESLQEYTPVGSYFCIKGGKGAVNE